MFIPDMNILVAMLASAACLFLVISGAAKGARMRTIVGGIGVAALMVAVALIADRFL